MMNVAMVNRRNLLILTGAAASASFAPTLSWATAPLGGHGQITDMTTNSPTYTTAIGYGRAQMAHEVFDPLAFAF
ncbi:MAG: hypothetical protein ABIP24_08320 [Croceibacterium sp.]